MVVGFTTTCAISANHHLVASLNLLVARCTVVKFDSDLQQVVGFLLVFKSKNIPKF
jgi:hypothetical protein